MNSPQVPKPVEQAWCTFFTPSVSDIVQIFLFSKEWRIGPQLSKSVIQNITAIVQKHVQEKLPIPVLIAAAPCKIPATLPKSNRVDLMEVSALKVLKDLQKRVQAIYPSGLEIRIRMEDCTVVAVTTFVNDAPFADYMRDFNSLIRFMDMQSFVTTVPESSMVSKEDYLNGVNKYCGLFLEHLRNPSSQDTREKLKEIGWGFPVSPEMKEFLTCQFKINYPHCDDTQALELVSRFFASTLTRKLYKAYGESPNWKYGKLEISFCPPHPDTPKDSARLYLRSASLECGNTNLPFWRGRLFVRNSNEKGVEKAPFGIVKTEEALDESRFDSYEMEMGSDATNVLCFSRHLHK